MSEEVFFYRFTTIIEGYVVREISEDEKIKLRELTEQNLAQGLKIVDFKIEKLGDTTKNQSVKVDPISSMSEMVSKLKQK